MKFKDLNKAIAWKRFNTGTVCIALESGARYVLSHLYINTVNELPVWTRIRSMDLETMQERFFKVS